MHGQDSIVTGTKLGMPTTNGSPAFRDATAMRSAEVVDRLVEAGMIVLGKANLTEASGMKVLTQQVDRNARTVVHCLNLVLD
jgi:Asp-tRNA(Asn)/Glu-tRNA(Gln) amidotransferase A subunit family amidase